MRLKQVWIRSVMTCVIVIAALNATAQTTFEAVYNIFNTSCAFGGCHGNSNPILGLDLEGDGINAMMDVYDNIVGVTPANAFAAGKGYEYIKPGLPTQSFIFRKAHNGLDPTIVLDNGEGGVMPASGDPLSDEDAELIRQWILHGAPFEGQVIDPQLISDFYNNNGIESVPSPPPAPDPSEGFQLHLGPFFIPPGSEREVFLKYDPMFDADIEVKGVETFMGNQSHHFILYKFFEEGQTFCGVGTGDLGPDDFSEGFRDIDLASHSNANYQFGAQESERVDLPYNTAFKWGQDAVLDLNSHYINTNGTSVLSGDVYLNIYTQEAGTAAHEMESVMIPNTSIDIPNDGQEITFTENLPVQICYPNGMYLWATNTHTHKYGTDYDLYKTDLTGNITDHFYDASCFEDGIPGCQTEFYDYQHPPTRVFEDYYYLGPADVVRHEASYLNDGPEPVSWGFTSEDEMMLFFFFYVSDTSGIGQPNAAPVALNDNASVIAGNTIPIVVLDNDEDVGGSLNTAGVTILQEPEHGSVVVNGDGSVSYTADAGYDGNDSFVYQVCDEADPPLCDSATVTISVSNPTGVFESTHQLLSVYPNPTSGQLTIELNHSGNAQIQLIDLQGRIVWSKVVYDASDQMIDLNRSGLSEGIYWLEVKSDQGDRSIARVVYRP